MMPGDTAQAFILANVHLSLGLLSVECVCVESPSHIKVTLYFVDIFTNAKFLREFCGSDDDYCYGFWVQMIIKSN